MNLQGATAIVLLVIHVSVAISVFGAAGCVGRVAEAKKPPPEAKATPAVTTTHGVKLKSSPAPAPVTAPEDWYAPIESDFRAAYQQDKTNEAKQAWSEYWGWVKDFYNGNFLSEGWTSKSTSLLKDMKEPAARNEMRGMLNDLGRRICADWAKDNDVRKISTQDLRAFGKRLLDARMMDDGSGKAIRAEIHVLDAEVKARLTSKNS